MNTAILTVALVGAWLPGVNAVPAWQASYSQAQQQSSAQRKPLVVVFGSGPNGWTKVIRSDGPTTEFTKLLSDHYVCVYVDTANAAGKKLAHDFDISQGLGLVISDRAGSMQAFWHQGDMSNQNMTTYLTKFANPNLVVQTTETAATPRTSFYPAMNGGGQEPSRTIRSANC
jgi:hypothetical protein